MKPSVSIEEEPGAAAEAATKPEDSAAAGEPDSLARGVEGSAAAVAETAAEVAQVAEEVLEPEGVETANGESAVPADNDHETGTRLEAGEAAATEDDKMDVASPAPVVETAQEESAPAPAAPAPPKPRPSNQFGLYFVGSKYSPNNYWCGVDATWLRCTSTRKGSAALTHVCPPAGLAAGGRRTRSTRPRAPCREPPRSTFTIMSRVSRCRARCQC